MKTVLIICAVACLASCAFFRPPSSLRTFPLVPSAVTNELASIIVDCSGFPEATFREAIREWQCMVRESHPRRICPPVHIISPGPTWQFASEATYWIYPVSPAVKLELEKVSAWGMLLSICEQANFSWSIQHSCIEFKPRKKDK